ncbi:hypothetical protein BGX26_001235, partial [Mortierella sp. AD094]
MESFVTIKCLDINDKMRKSTQTPNEVPENAGNVELLEYPEGSERNVYQENPLPLENIENRRQPIMDIPRYATAPAIALETLNAASVNRNISDSFVTIRDAVNFNDGVSTSFLVANEASVIESHEIAVADAMVCRQGSIGLSSSESSDIGQQGHEVGNCQSQVATAESPQSDVVTDLISTEINIRLNGSRGMGETNVEATESILGTKRDESASFDVPSITSALVESFDQRLSNKKVHESLSRRGDTKDHAMATSLRVPASNALDQKSFFAKAPSNHISFSATRITPELLPLIDITQGDINMIGKQIKSGVANIQDIYALSPLQDGILFHHITATKGDPYLVITHVSFDDRDALDRYLDASQKVIDRHDILRTAFVWREISRPVQVVLRHASTSIDELPLSPVDGPILEQLMARFNTSECRIDLTQAPLIRFAVAQDGDGRWILVRLMHHLIDDQYSSAKINFEIQALLEGQEEKMRSPKPLRDFIAQTQSGPSAEDHELFFTNMLAEIDTPALPYGLSNVHNDGMDVTESHLVLPQELNIRLRDHAKRMGVSLASLCHLAWAQVISRTSGQERVVFGTVLLGRMQGGSISDRTMGLFINTLPLRIDVGERSVEESVHHIQADLAALFEHEHAPLALAQRCSSVPSGTPLFSSLLNYRHDASGSGEVSSIDSVNMLVGQQRTNYPFSISVEDGGSSLGLTALVVKQFDASRVCGYMQQTLQSLVEALEHSPNMQVRYLEILPDIEREMLLRSWSTHKATYPDHHFIHQLFESRAEESPDSIAVVFENQEISYRELNARANSLAHYLIDLGVKPDSLVAICVSRSIAMIIGLLAVLKAGGAYVPLDPTFASERLNDILADASPSILLADKSGTEALHPSILLSMKVINLNVMLEGSTNNPVIPELMPHHLAYVIYTSGSTGKPKG